MPPNRDIGKNKMENMEMNDDQFGQIMGAIGSLKASQENLYRELLGNGQPGRIQLIEGRVAAVEASTAKIDKLQWKLGTISAGAGAILALGIEWVTKRVLHLS